MANTKFEVILGMLFLKMSNTDISFGEKTLMWKSYTTNKAPPITKQVQIRDKKDFVIAMLNVNCKTFVVHMAIQKREKMPMYLKKQAQIQEKVQVRALIFDEALTIVSVEYSDYSNVFSMK